MDNTYATKLYHASNQIVEKPQIINRFKTLDFGNGFYATENKTQAENFALKVYRRRNFEGEPIVNCYEFNQNLKDFAVLKFDFANEKWLDFVVARRRGIEPEQKYDLIVGPVANDDVFGTIILYETNQINKQEAIERFKVKKLYNQILFCNECALEKLIFVNFYKVKEKNEK